MIGIVFLVVLDLEDVGLVDTLNSDLIRNSVSKYKNAHYFSISQIAGVYMLLALIAFS